MFYLFNNERKIFLSLIFFTFIAIAVSDDEQLISAKNVTCEKIESSEFPEDIFTTGQRKCGAIILHLIFFGYCFWAIALVCSERFLPTINCICEDLKLSEDVAAATFMSIATSAPELFSNIIGTFITESSIGIGHVIGNGYYNMFFVAAVGGLATSQTSELILEWWPLTRDCFIYALVAFVLTLIVWDGAVTTLETVVLLLLYCFYFLVMFTNKKVISFLSKKLKRDIFSHANEEKPPETNAFAENTKHQEKVDIEEVEPLEPENFQLPPPLRQSTPEEKNERWNKAIKLMSFPIEFLMSYTIPDVRVETRRKYYSVSFVICVTWIGISTYLGTWMISVIGETLGVPDLIMGMTFMAAAGSVVEAYSVYYKVRRGNCGIGLSNSLGCNTLDATLCLALPWFVKTLMPFQSTDCRQESSNVVLDSSLIHINCALLVASVLALYFIFYLNKFKLDKRLGLVSGILYALVIFIAISIENYSQSVSQ